MIIPNGHIEIQAVVGGDINPETGFATPAQGVWSERIACQYTPKSYHHASKVNGEFYTLASYEILIDELSVDGLQPTMIRISDERGLVLGEYPVINIQHYRGARIYKITI